MPSILVTGATGFIGRACLKALEGINIEVHATHRCKPIIPNSHVHWHLCDILNLEEVTTLIKTLKPDYLIHLAWIVDHTIYWTSDKNIEHQFATIHLYKEFSSQGGKKGLFIGTCAEYDRSYSVCDEQKTPLRPTTLYGICKKQTLDFLTQLKIEQPNLADFSWVRLFNIYGPHEQDGRLIPYIFLSYLKGNIPKLQNPYSIRDYIHVQNLADILVDLSMRPSPVIINIGSGVQLSLMELASIISFRYFNNLPALYQVGKKPEQLDKLVPDLSLLKKIGYQPSLSFESSLDNVFEWFKIRVKPAAPTN